MKMKTMCMFLSLVLAGAFLANAQTISFYQGEKELTLQKTDQEYLQLNLKPEPFTMTFRGDQLHVCTGLTKDIFTNTKPKTDINADFNSCFFIYKYGAMEKNADYLLVGSETPTALNEEHGAIRDGKQSKFKVNSLYIDEAEKPLSSLKEFYLALWLDGDKDQYIDEKELTKVKVNIE